MSKTAKILILLTFLALCLVLYLIFSAQIVTIQPGQEQSINQADKAKRKSDLVKLTDEYKKNMAEILSQWEKIWDDFSASSSIAAIGTSTEKISAATSTNLFGAASSAPAIKAATGSEETILPQPILDRLAALKINLMSARVPEQFKKFHLKLVMGLSSFKNAWLAKDELSEKKALNQIKEAIEEYKKITDN